MNAVWFGLAVLTLVYQYRCVSSCSQTSYYSNCWIRRFPGLFIDLQESEQRGAQVLQRYQAESALRCSRTCCLTHNFSCNLAVFHYESVEEKVNCFHLHCPALGSCILTHRGTAVLYNITNGVDPDLLVFGKYFTSNVRLIPHHYSRINASDLLPSDKRHFIFPPPPAAPSTTITASTISRQSSTFPTATPTVSPTEEAFPGDKAKNTSRFPTVTTLSLHKHETFSASTAQPAPSHLINTSSPTSTMLLGNLESSKQNSNHSTGKEDTSAGSDGGWNVTAHTLQVTVCVFIIVLLSCCCCSALLLLSWRGRRKRKGNYHTLGRGTQGSTRPVKYVLVRETPQREEMGK
ncbi:MANSC domain-containing protein 4 [Gouania willdenowi]|uniref:MANSC domain-containing protein n=1 Tax=Gouania willdenowi TaxID=441366 RepID=A0A8C5GK72_GOUWI|nr:MANSC domain-containing protein 4 [Gouania willdenowi]